MNRRRLTLIGLGTTVIAGALALYACGGQQEAPPPVRPVKLVTVGSAAVTPTVELAGEVRARVESRLGFRVAGKILSRRVEAGQRVQRGEELARIDPRDYELARQAAQSQLVAAKQEHERARLDLARFEALRDQGYVSASELDRARVTLASAAAMLEQATSQAALDANRLGDTVLRAGASGVIVAVIADVGEVVEPGAAVVVLAHDGPREVVVEFPEDRTPLARLAQAEVSLWAAPQVRFPAKLRELSAAADPVTRTFRARYSVQAPADALALGQSASLVLQVPADPRAAQGGMRLPTTALVEDQGRTSVWVYDPATSTVQRTPVQIAGLDGNDVIVAGIADGAQVVVAGVHVLNEGQVVRPLGQPPATPTSPAAASR